MHYMSATLNLVYYMQVLVRSVSIWSLKLVMAQNLAVTGGYVVYVWVSGLKTT